MDIISINFAEKVPFRLKQPMVKAAIEVYALLDYDFHIKIDFFLFLFCVCACGVE